MIDTLSPLRRRYVTQLCKMGYFAAQASGVPQRQRGSACPTWTYRSPSRFIPIRKFRTDGDRQIPESESETRPERRSGMRIDFVKGRLHLEVKHGPARAARRKNSGRCWACVDFWSKLWAQRSAGPNKSLGRNRRKIIIRNVPTAETAAIPENPSMLQSTRSENR